MKTYLKMTLFALAVSNAPANAFEMQHTTDSVDAQGIHRDVEQQTFIQGWQDATIETSLLLNPVLRGYRIEAEVVDGTATLKGSVSNEVEAELAGEIALNVEGIRKVINVLKLQDQKNHQISEKDSSFIQNLADATLSAKAKARLLASQSINGMDINVTTRHGVVTLRGSVDHGAKKELAIYLVKNISGVTSVNADIDINS